MPDKHCGKCGEPWEMYYVNGRWDELLSEDEIEAAPDDMKHHFMSGKGCPTCEWSKRAGEVSQSRGESEEETEARHIRDLFDSSVTDEDPLKYL